MNTIVGQDRRYKILRISVLCIDVLIECIQFSSYQMSKNIWLIKKDKNYQIVE